MSDYVEAAVNDYTAFLAGKDSSAASAGLTDVPPIQASLFPFQRDITTWALRRGRAAIFAATGLGKTRMQIEWARIVASATGGRVLVLAPLAVAQQTCAEAAAIGVVATHARDSDDGASDVVVTNYERLHRFDPADYVGVVLDESSCIKHQDSHTFASLCDAFRETPYRLACTATPAPNDWIELGTHAEFLGVRTRAEMLSEFFVHDGGNTSSWRLKGHARDAFWSWVASWAALVRSPDDLGYDAAAFALPPLVIREHYVPSSAADLAAAGRLFAATASTLADQRAARRTSIGARVAACAAVVNAEPAESWIVWCELNAEGDALRRAISGAVEIRGSDDMGAKESRLIDFAVGRTRVLVSKPSIAGYGLNWQHCARIAFVGVTHSWESYFQAIRRCWRFGQMRQVEVHVFASDMEGDVVASLRRKDAAAAELATELAAATALAVAAQIRGATRDRDSYSPTCPMEVPRWLTCS